MIRYTIILLKVKMAQLKIHIWPLYCGQSFKMNYWLKSLKFKPLQIARLTLESFNTSSIIFLMQELS